MDGMSNKDKAYKGVFGWVNESEQDGSVQVDRMILNGTILILCLVHGIR